MALLEVRSLVKTFGNTQAVRGISFDIAEGRCVTLLGPNGAGKTTTLSMLSGLLVPTSGAVRFAGVDTSDPRHLIGYLPQYPAFYPWMSGKEYLTFVGELAFLSRKEASKRADEVLELIDLKSAAKRRIGGYSGGMKQRLGIAQAIIHRPRLLILDEPVSALDPIGRREVLDLLEQLKKETTILFSTHVLHDAEEVSDDLLIMRQGEIVISGDLREVMAAHRRSAIVLEVEQTASTLRDALLALPDVADVEVEGSRYIVHLQDLETGRQALMEWCVAHKVAVHKFEVEQPTLEGLFMKAVIG